MYQGGTLPAVLDSVISMQAMVIKEVKPVILEMTHTDIVATMAVLSHICEVKHEINNISAILLTP